MAVMDSIKAIGHGIGWLIPGVQEAQAMEASANAHRQKSLNDAVNRAIQYETANPRNADEDPDYKNRLTRLFDMQGKVQQMGPFDNPKSLGGQFWHDYVSLHPDALMPQPQAPKPPTQVPGPAMQGQPSGVPNIVPSAPSVPSIDQMTGGAVGAGIPSMPPSPSTAMPSTSPVSPQAQASAALATQPKGGGTAQNAPSAFPEIPEPPAITGMGDTGDQDSPASFSITKTALGGPPELVMPQRPAPIRMPVSLSGDVSEPLARAAMESQQPYIQSQAAVEQALNTLRGTNEFNLATGQRKVQMIKDMVGADQWAATPDLIKTSIISSAMGVNIPGIAGMFAAPQKEFMDANKLSPAEKRQYGIPENATGDYTVLRNRLGQVVGAFPGRSKLAMAMDAYGREYITDQEALTPGAPIPAGPGQAYNPAAFAPQGVTQQQPTPGGGVQTTRTETKRVATAPPTAAAPGVPAAPAAAAPAKSAAISPKPVTPAGTSYSHPTPSNDVTRRVDTFGHLMTPTRVAQVDNAVLALLRPNQSNAQLNEAMKVYEGSDKWLADQVRARLAQDQTPVISWDLGTSQRAQFSNQALTHMDTINSLIDDLDKKGKLGPIMSRWNDFMLGKVGAGDPDYAKLRNQIDLMTKALGVVHGGARGGGSIQMYQSFLDKINPSIMDATSLKSAMSVEKEWLTTYANPAKTAGVLDNKTTPITPLPGTTKAKVWDERTQTFK